MKQGMRAMAGAVALVGLLATAGPAVAKDRVIAVDGVSKADANQRVEILVHVPEGESASAAAEKALAGQGAKKAPKPPPEQPQSNSYSFTGLFWDTRRVTQNYNPLGERVAGAQTALTNTLPDWSNVANSDFDITFGGNTNRCPSLVRECPGAQVNDRLNDVGWAQLANGTLGVTWSTSGTDEADMAINTRYSWNTGCRAVSGSFDLESVILHENGHVVGLGHSTDTSAVMYPSYQTARCSLAADDQAGMAELY
ncbi:MAG TPA: matrixin family metalloprotease [Solirubrobacteraceae bacterium]|nr:matrixin family metalloprotease [Solirubrobacteraceae bacterium]